MRVYCLCLSGYLKHYSLGTATLTRCSPIIGQFFDTMKGIHIGFFSSSHQPGKYARWYNCPGKILLVSSIGTNGNWTACKWTVSIIIIFHVTSLPVHHARSCRCQPTKKIQVQMKTKASLTAMRAERNAFALPARIWFVFPKCYHYYLTPYPYQNSWCDRAMCCCWCRCSAEHQQLTKWKLSRQWFHS